MSAAGIIAEFLAQVGFKADEASLDSALGKVKGFGLGIAAIAGAAAAAVLAVADKYDELGRASERLAVPVAKLQELNYVATQTGASADAVAASLSGIRAANPRIKDAAAALEKAGQNMRGMSRAAREAYASRMGIDPALIPMLIKDTAELKAEWSSMYATAGLDAQAAAEGARGLMGELGKLKAISTMLGDAVSLTFVVRIRREIERLRRGIIEHFAAIKRVMEGVVTVALRIVGAVSAMAGRIIGWLMQVVDWFEGLDDAQQKAVAGVGAMLAAWRLLNLGFLATPLGMIIASLTAIVALVDDYLTYMEGGTAFFDWEPWEGTINRVVTALKPIADILKGIGQGIIAAVLPAIDTLVTMIGGMANMFRHVIDLVVALFSGDFAGAFAAASALVDTYVETTLAVFGGLCRTVAAFFEAVWPSVAANFPDFAAWAEGAAKAITEIIGAALSWLDEKLGSIMPDWMKSKGSRPVLDAPVLTPSPAVASAAAASAAGTGVKLDQKTDINIYTSADPQAVGQAVAARQDDVNGRLIRNTAGAVR